jgi:hypothetical protein
MYFPSFSELLLIGSFLGVLVLIIAYVQTDEKDKQQKSKIRNYFFLFLISYIILLFILN